MHTHLKNKVDNSKLAQQIKLVYYVEFIDDTICLLTLCNKSWGIIEWCCGWAIYIIFQYLTGLSQESCTENLQNGIATWE